MEFKVAVTSTDGVHVDQHFGRAADFLVLVVRGESGEAESEGRRRVPASDVRGSHAAGVGIVENCIGGNLELLEETGVLLADCRYLLTAAIGRRPQSVLLRHGISALETDRDLGAAVSLLSKYLTAGPAVGSSPSCRINA